MLHREPHVSGRGLPRLLPGGQRGLTLVEVLVATLLLAFLTLSSVSVLSTVLAQNRLARNRSVATSLAAERIEHLTSQTYAGVSVYQRYLIPGETAQAGPPPTLTADYGAIPGFPEYRRTVTLDYDVPVAGMVKVTVDVFWNELQQGEKSHRFVSYLHPQLEGRI